MLKLFGRLPVLQNLHAERVNEFGTLAVGI